MSHHPDPVGSHWMQTVDFPAHPPLTDPAVADVAVIGGGIAGLSTAWELARAGRSVVLLEAGRIAAGVTGHTTGKLTALHTTVYDGLRRRRGPQAAREYAQSQSAALERVREVAARLGADCELESRSAYTYCEDADGVDALRAEAEAARDAGLDAEFVTETGLPFPVAGAVRVAGQAQFHPRKYLRALADDVTALGGRIHEHSRVTDLVEGDPCRITTEAGVTVLARDVVVATHYPVFDRAMLFTRLTPHRDVVIAGPLRADRDPDGMYITREGGKRSVRTAPYGDDRLLILTGEAFTPGDGGVEARYERLSEWLHERFPGVPVTHRWAAQDNAPTDTVPLIGPFHAGSSHVYVATGFSGWGMSGGVMAGQLLRALIDGPAPAWAELYDPRRLGPVLKDAPAFLKAQLRTGKHLVGDRLEALTEGARPTVDELPPGGGAVVRVQGKPCAVHRDDEGRLHAVSATCTHMGCVVAFNDAERTWECPCHGSRFGVDGDVLQGPALRPLERRDVEDL
ncbi:FAD-dependent oxidoreductase [Streptomyces sp. NPDC003038]|uniref:FAD-dependent oxidoreductase n=1 Tax=unclassified Streptomyces TaxID=2593676 RepID=UPI0033A5E223